MFSLEQRKIIFFIVAIKLVILIKHTLDVTLSVLVNKYPFSPARTITVYDLLPQRWSILYSPILHSEKSVIWLTACINVECWGNIICHKSVALRHIVCHFDAFLS